MIWKFKFNWVSFSFSHKTWKKTNKHHMKTLTTHGFLLVTIFRVFIYLNLVLQNTGCDTSAAMMLVSRETCRQGSHSERRLPGRDVLPLLSRHTFLPISMWSNPKLASIHTWWLIYLKLTPLLSMNYLFLKRRCMALIWSTAIISCFEFLDNCPFVEDDHGVKNHAYRHWLTIPIHRAAIRTAKEKKGD